MNEFSLSGLSSGLSRWFRRPLDRLRDLVHGSNDDLRNLYTDPPRSRIALHPDVPPPDNLLSPVALAVRWASNDLYGEEMPEIASALLGAGLDTPALRRLAGETEITSRADAEPFVHRVFNELGVPYPVDETTARLWVSRQVSREVIAGLRNPWSAANHLELTVWGGTAPNAELQTIFQINDEINWDATYRRSHSALTADIIETLAQLAKLNIAGYP